MKSESHRRYVDYVVALGLFVASLAVYNATLTPSLSYKSADGNELATIPYILGLAHSTGYPLYTWLGKLFTFIPVGDIAHRVNLMSAVMGAGGVAWLYIVILKLIGAKPGLWDRLAAAFAALFFAFSLTFWSQTTIAEVYAPNVFMIGLTLWLLLRWAERERAELAEKLSGGDDKPWWRRPPSGAGLAWFGAFALAFGLSLGTHMSNLGFAPAFALFVALISWRFAFHPISIAVGAAGFALGVAQFLWLPFKANTLNDVLMRRHAPSTLREIYNYTLGAFPQFKFAFTLPQIPDRIVIYLDYVVRQFGIIGMAIGLIGMALMIFRRPRHFALLFGMYIVHVWFFIQYGVFDLDVFFIPAHYIFAAFIGYAVWAALEGVWGLLSKRSGLTDRMLPVAAVIATVILALPILGNLIGNWEANDCSQSTEINDFYENVFRILPEGAVLLGNSGVFGYDMFYWRLVYNVRPDVLMPHLSPDVSREELVGREVYSTVRLGPEGGGFGPGRLPAGLVERSDWLIPVLLGNGGNVGARELILWRVSDSPPELITYRPEPQTKLEISVDGLTLLGYDIESDTLHPGGVAHLRLYWRLDNGASGWVSVWLGGRLLEQHEVGLWNLDRYRREFNPGPDAVIVEDYLVVIPSTVEPGEAELSVAIGSPFGRLQVEPVPIGTVTIVEEG